MQAEVGLAQAVPQGSRDAAKHAGGPSKQVWGTQAPVCGSSPCGRRLAEKKRKAAVAKAAARPALARAVVGAPALKNLWALSSGARGRGRRWGVTVMLECGARVAH